MKKLLPILFIVLLTTFALARIRESWSYERLTKEADVIVIATPVSVIDQYGEVTTLPNVVRIDTNNVRTPIPAMGVETTFEILSSLKGNITTNTLVFHHLRETDKPKLTYGPPGLVAFDPKGNKRFLLFLKREPDGRYAPVTGQTDPDQSVKDLGVYPP